MNSASVAYVIVYYSEGEMRMDHSVYESHMHQDPDFPIIFHLDELKNDVMFIAHWHESIELLYFIDGKGIVLSGTTQFEVSAGDVVIINSNNLHSIRCVDEPCQYFCLIVDKEFCEQFGITIGEITFQTIVKDNSTKDYFDKIIYEMMAMKPYYKSAVKSMIVAFLVHLCRYFVSTESTLSDNRSNNKINMIKSAISYIKQHYEEEITIDDICRQIGFSKYYFCRIFKEITEKTVVDYINFLRCSHARALLATGKYNVTESAEMSGIHNLSYFTKVYKKHMGISPSKEKAALTAEQSGDFQK